MGFADFVEAGEDVCAKLSSGWRSHVPDRFEKFPYPNGDKLRWVSVIRCPDLVLLRAAGGRIAMTTEPLLTDRVFSSRLQTAGAAWSMENGLHAYKRWEEEALADIDREPLSEAWKTDVADYYASVDHHVLLERMSRWRCGLEDIRLVMTMLHEWSLMGLSGLPIGPEASAVLGTALLINVDEALARVGVSHYRYMDDIVVIGRGLMADDLSTVVDNTLEPLQLRRSEAKTVLYPAGTAREAVEDVVLGYLAGRTRVTRTSRENLVGLLESEARLPYTNPKRVRFALGGLMHDGDDSALELVLGSHAVLNSDPKATCRYAGRFGLEKQHIRESLMDLLARPRSDEFDALRLHVLRAAARARWGRTEGRQLLATALDDRERAEIRANAWFAAARSPAWRSREVMEIADEERHPSVKRAAVLTLRRAPETRLKAAYLKKVESDPFLMPAARWATAA